MLLVGLVIGIFLGVAMPRGETTAPTPQDEKKEQLPEPNRNDRLGG